MALNIKNQDVEHLLDEVVEITGESKTEAVRQALEERLQRLSLRVPGDNDFGRLINFLEEEIWPQVPPELMGVGINKKEREDILGYGDWGI